MRAAEWFHHWSAKFDRDAFDDILDVETGGMLEVWADLYGVTGERKHLDLVHRCTRSRLIEPLLEGRDVLTNRHANTTIPEMHGAAHAYEVTGDGKWRDFVETYRQNAVVERGHFCTGGQTCGEVWTPPFRSSLRLGDTNQEHCVVYNMIRLADWLHRWTGEASLADYIERNTFNGILAQQNPTPGTHTHTAYVYYARGKGLLVSQYVPTDLRLSLGGTELALSVDAADSLGRVDIQRPHPVGPESRHRAQEYAASGTTIG